MSLFGALFGEQAQDARLAALFGPTQKNLDGVVQTPKLPQAAAGEQADTASRKVLSASKKRKQAPAAATEDAVNGQLTETTKAKKKTKRESRKQSGEQLDHEASTEPRPAEVLKSPAKRIKMSKAPPPFHATTAAGETQEEHQSAGPAEAPAVLPDSAAADAERLGRTIFVGNLPANINPKILKRAFSKYGRVESLRLRSQALAEDSKLSTRVAVRAGQLNAAKGTAHAYLVFLTQDSAQAALAHNMQQIEGLHIRVDKASERRTSKKEDAGVFYHPGRTLFVGNLPFDASDEEVIQHFNSLQDQLALESPPVTAVRVVREPRTGTGRGIAYVEMAAKGAVSGALRLLQGNPLRGRELRLERVSTAGASPPSQGLKSGSHNHAKVGQSRAAAVDTWQGVRTKGQFKRIRPGFSAAKPSQHTNGISPRRESRAEMTKQRKSGKRPSVAARKAGLKGHIVRPDKKKLIRKKEARQQRKS